MKIVNRTLLFLATLFCCLDSVKASTLLQDTIRDATYQLYPLGIACRNNDMETIKQLLAGKDEPMAMGNDCYEFDTELGRMAVVLVGAMIVAGIETVATGKVKPTGRVELQHHQMQLDKGAELGRFYLGSTAVVLFEKDKMMWEEQFKANSTVVMGERLGHSV
jgi:phosphatidylserine decarboxylase precursor